MKMAEPNVPDHGYLFLIQTLQAKNLAQTKLEKKLPQTGQEGLHQLTGN
jgi:hypothetical protein